jgi:hypothetical protein
MVRAENGYKNNSMWWQSSRLDRIEKNMEQMQQSIRELAEISNATNRRIDRFVEEMRDRE